MNDQPKTVAGFQWLRIFAAFGVVMIHVCSTHWSAVGPDTPQWAALAFWDSLVRWPVPVFVMITGALFLPRVTALKTILTRYIPRIFAAFCLWTLVYTFRAFREGVPAPDLLVMLCKGEYHMWYLPFLCGIYLVLPFVQKIVTDPRLENQLLAVGLFIGMAVPWLADLGAALWPNWGNVIRAMENNLNYTFFFDLLSLLVLGHWLHTRELTCVQRRILYTLGLLSLLLTGPLTIRLSRWLGVPSSLFFDHASPTTLFAAAALFVFAKYHLTKLPKWAALTARLSFGVYLSHVLVLQILVEKGYHALSFSPVWFVPVLTLGVFLLSLALTAILSRIPVLGKYMT